jgi:hypothetical protein
MTPTFEEIVADAIVSAEASDADNSQLELLRSAAAGVAITFEDIELATEETFTCFEDNGIGYTRMSPDRGMGFLSLSTRLTLGFRV